MGAFVSFWKPLTAFLGAFVSYLEASEGISGNLELCVGPFVNLLDCSEEMSGSVSVLEA